MKRAVLVALNTPGYYNLAIHSLRLYAARDKALLRQCRIFTAEYDLRTADSDILGNLVRLQPELIAFSCYVWNITKSLGLARALKKLLPASRLLFGGQEVTHSTLSYLEQYPFLDIVADGEGEETFRRILLSMTGDDFLSLKDIPGIQYRCGDSWHSNPPAAEIGNLDQLPSPYLENAVSIPPGSPLGVMIEHARGCPGNCAFCFEALRAGRPRFFSTERVAAEIRWALLQGHDYVHLLDPVLAGNDPQRLASLHRILSEERRRSCFRVSVEIDAERVQDGNRPLFDCYQVFDVGLQTVNPAANRAIRRPFHREAFAAGFERLRSLGRRINLYLIYGLPEDDYAEFMKGICFAESLGEAKIFLNRLCVLDGTPLRREARKLGLEYRDTPPYEILSHPTYSFADIAKSESFARNYMRFHGTAAWAAFPA